MPGCRRITAQSEQHEGDVIKIGARLSDRAVGPQHMDEPAIGPSARPEEDVEAVSGRLEARCCRANGMTEAKGVDESPGHHGGMGHGFQGGAIAPGNILDISGQRGIPGPRDPARDESLDQPCRQVRRGSPSARGMQSVFGLH